MSGWDFGRVIESTTSGRARLKRIREDDIETKEATYFEKMPPSETPLLVDALAKMVVGMIDAMTGSWYVYRTIPGTQEVDKEIVCKAGALIAQAHVLVCRYKEEVGDGS